MELDINHIELISGSVIAVMGIMFMLIHVQKEEEWSQFRKMRIILAISYILLSASNLYHGITNASVDTSELSTALSLIIGSFQALLFTATCMVLVAPGAATISRIGLNAMRIAIQGVVLVSLLTFGNMLLYKIAFWGIVCIYIYKLVQYSRSFIRYYHRSSDSVDDDLQRQKLTWVRNFFVTALCIGIVNLVVVILPASLVLDYMFCVAYTLYYVYFSISLINYRIDFDALIKYVYKASIEEKTLLNEKQILELESKLDRWVADKKFTEKDILPEKLAEDLGTTRRALAWYFTNKLNTNFRSWRLALRMEEAKRLLREENVSTANVYELVGVADKSNFHKHFRKITGLTPTEYKAQFEKPE